jgi:hypothetical protein
MIELVEAENLVEWLNTPSNSTTPTKLFGFSRHLAVETPVEPCLGHVERCMSQYVYLEVAIGSML